MWAAAWYTELVPVPDLLIAVSRVGTVVVPLPRYQTDGSAGMDLHAAIEQPLVVPPLGRVKVPTGLAFAIPESFEGQVRPRSGLASRGLTVLNAPGTIDSDYRGEIVVLLVNLGKEPHTLMPGDRVAQMVIAPVSRATIEEVAELTETVRGTGGFGHTG
jgi:dUTP pyrophosphatase